MGAKSVGELQYDENQMERGARLHVLVEDEEFFLKTSVSSNKSNKPASSVIKRNVQTKSESAVDDITSAVQDVQINDGQTDPLKWFGVLVPQSLRQAQTKFKRAAEVSCKVASLKAKYCQLQEQFRSLKSEKWHLLNDPPEF